MSASVRLLLASVLLSFGHPLFAQLQINEIVASNTRSYPDITDFEDYPDWFELKNTGATPLLLNDHFISDDPSDPFKWPVPTGLTMPPGGYQLFMADGHDAAPGQVFPRGYWPWRNFTTEKYHTNFSLSADGEALVLTQATGVSAVTLVNASTPAPVAPATVAVWKYKDDGSDLGTQWRARSYSDTAWLEGPAELGYADSPATAVSFGPSSTNKYVTTYFRHHFNVANPAAFHGLTLKLLVDDGAIVYLNGTEIVRRNMPAGEINYRTLATTSVAGTDESTFFNYTISPKLLVPGDNVLAVEVHQNSASSTDLSFDLGLVASSHTGHTVLDSVTFPTQVSDVSFGRDRNTGAWKQIAVPTPGTENADAEVVTVRVVGNDVTASPGGGLYATDQNVTLSSPAGVIHYTLNGSDPTPASPQYTAPIPITATTVLRARCFTPGKPAGQILTQTYFRNETMTNLPYVSVVADPKTMFDPQIGIYLNDHEPVNATYNSNDVYKGKDAPGHVEFFDPSGSSFTAGVGIRIGGENNWVHAQKALNLAIRTKYGTEDINFQLIPGANLPRHTAFTLRDGGDNWNKDMLKDGLIAMLAVGTMNVDVAEYRPVLVFINGAFWGIHDLRPRWDDTWFAQKYRVPADKIDHLLYGHVTSSDITLGVDKGSDAEWLELMDFLKTANLSVQANWDYVESKIDVDSFIDWVVAESWANNSSWEHNREFWRDKRPGGKWRWFLTDMDRTLTTTTGAELADMLGTEDVLVRLKTNTGFKRRLAQRYAAHLASTFLPSRVIAMITAMDEEVSAHYPRHLARWIPDALVGELDQTKRDTAIANMKLFATNRAVNVHAEIATQLGVGGAVDMTVAVNDTSRGKVLIQGVAVPASTFKLFSNAPFIAKAVPAPGYTFAGWTEVAGGAEVTLSITGASTLTANFVPSGGTVVGGTLAADTTFSLAGSPYQVADDLIVPAGVTLTVQPGVQIEVAAQKNIRVQGVMNVAGTAAQPVHVIGFAGQRWGGWSFESPTGLCTLSHLFVRGATRGYDGTLYPDSVMARNGNFLIEFMDIAECDSTLYLYNCNSTVRDCRFHIPNTGDGLHVKKGSALVQRCVFPGNNAPDTDAIDFDAVVNGTIEDCDIYRFQGFNSDGIDLGEGCLNILVQGNRIFYNSDKGFSVGQASQVTLRKNLVVGCPLGVGIKDAGSLAIVDQNTFVGCDDGIALYEKNFGSGGGSAVITNTIFSKSGLVPVAVDGFSSVTISYCLSDTTALGGATNIVADPLFVDPVALNFQLKPNSPAINTGDPAHALDPDQTRVDIGAQYYYDPSDYPFTIGETVVINELLANSGLGADWIELHNRTNADLNIGGWFLSDSALDYQKYRIPPGTVIPARGFVVFREDVHFGPASVDPNKISAFGLSDTGEKVYLSSAVNDQLTDYRTQEDFGATSEGETLGTYYKNSSNSYNFVAMATPTPGGANSYPRVGPIVISEIMYNPAGSGTGDAEYIELLNISKSAVTLYDPDKNAGWRLSDGVEFQFSTTEPVIIPAGKRIVLTKNATLFTQVFGALVPPQTQVLEWSLGGLANSGETLQLDKPGPFDAANVLQFVRHDRVNFDDDAPWPKAPDGGGTSLTRVFERHYGNDFVNWMAAPPSPGSPSTQARPDLDGDGIPDAYEIPIGFNASDSSDTWRDNDGDGQSNRAEYFAGTNPLDATDRLHAECKPGAGPGVIQFTAVEGVGYAVEYKDALNEANWHLLTSVAPRATTEVVEVPDPGAASHLQRFYRVVVP